MSDFPQSRDALLDDADHPFTTERHYVRVTPKDRPLSPELVTANIPDLHGLCQPPDGRLPWQTRSPATIEMLLVAEGTPQQRRIDYLFGIDEPRLTEALADTLRGWFPTAQVTVDELRVVEALDLEAAAVASLDDTSDATPLADYAIGGLELVGRPLETDDWQTGLSPLSTFTDDGQATYPLAGVVSALRNSSVPMVFQTVIEPLPDWSSEASARLDALTPGDDSSDSSSMREGFAEAFGPPKRDHEPNRARHSTDTQQHLNPKDETRRDKLQDRDPTTSFSTQCRALTFSTDPEAGEVALEQLQPRFRKLGTSLYRLSTRTYEPGSKAAAALARRVAERQTTPHDHWSWQLRRRLPGTTVCPALVTDPETLPALTVLDGPSLTPGGQRALAAVSSAQETLRLPNPDALEPFLGDGFFLGYPKTANGEVWDEDIAVPPELQLLHILIMAATGHGKSVKVTNGTRQNHAATEGATILTLPKGGSSADDYMRAHFADHGTLEDVFVFDCAETLPGISFFDIQPALDAGMDRGTVAHQRIQAFLDILKMVMSADAYESATRSRQALYWLLAAQYDPSFGGNSFGLVDVEQAVRELEQTGELPRVEDPALRGRLQDLRYEGGEVSDAVIRGVRARMQDLTKHDAVLSLFNYQPRSTDPRFEFSELLDEDVVIIFDTGGLSDTAQEVLSIMLFAKLWRAVRQRSEAYRSRVDTPPIVNLVVEEAKDVAVADLFQTLLSQGREFRLSTLLSMQRPGQLKEASPATYEELKTEVQTVVAGHQKASQEVADWFATDGDTDRMQSILGGLSPGEWLTLLPQEHGRPRPLRFKLESGGIPPGRPPEAESQGVPAERCFSEVQEQTYQSLKDRRLAETAKKYGIPSTSNLDTNDMPETPTTSVDDVTFDSRSANAAGLPDSMQDRPVDADETTARTAATPGEEAASGDQPATPSSTGAIQSDSETPTPPDVTDGELAASASNTDAEFGAAEESAAEQTDTQPSESGAGPVVASPLSLTDRLPGQVDLSDDERYLKCRLCGDSYDPTIEGMYEAITCHGSMDEVDRDAIPVCQSRVKLSPEQRREVDLTDGQLVFMQMVHDAKQFKHHDLEFNPLTDSCRLLRQYAGLDTSATRELREEGLVRRDTKKPRLMFSLTPRGRTLIGEAHREGVHHGDGKGDLNESLQHAVTVELTARYLREKHVADADVPRTVKRYHEVNGDRLDVVVLDATGDVHVAAEVERTTNHDTKEAVPSDYDKMVACDPAEVYWVTMTQRGGYQVLEALNEPADGQPRLTKMYSDSTPPRAYNIDDPGFSALFTMTRLQKDLVDDLRVAGSSSIPYTADLTAE